MLDVHLSMCLGALLWVTLDANNPILKESVENSLEPFGVLRTNVDLILNLFNSPLLIFFSLKGYLSWTWKTD